MILGAQGDQKMPVEFCTNYSFNIEILAFSNRIKTHKIYVLKLKIMPNFNGLNGLKINKDWKFFFLQKIRPEQDLNKRPNK